MPVQLTKNKRKYLAIYNHKSFKCDAYTMYQAQCIAIEHFKIPKSRQGLLALVLADTPIDTNSIG